MKSAESRFWSYVEKTEGCWYWKGACLGGYGRFHVGGSSEKGTKRQMKAHRYAYELLRQPIPQGATIDHLCRIPSCVNPWHLEVVTIEENQRRVPRRRRHCLTCTCVVTADGKREENPC